MSEARITLMDRAVALAGEQNINPVEVRQLACGIDACLMAVMPLVRRVQNKYGPFPELAPLLELSAEVQAAGESS